MNRRSLAGGCFAWVTATLVMLAGTCDSRAVDDDPARPVDTAIVLVTPMSIAEESLGGDDSAEYNAFIRWLKPTIAAVESAFARETRPRTVVVQVTLHPDRKADVVVAGNPEPTADEIKAILAVADPAKAPRSQVVDCTLRIVSKIRGGHPDPKQPLIPKLSTPAEMRMDAFREASPADKIATMKRWARTEAIPLIARTAGKAEARFEGVRNLAKTLDDLKPDAPIDADALTEANPDFWRAMMEMSPGIPYVQAARVALLTAEGKVYAADRLAKALAAFDRKNSVYSTLLTEFNAMSRMLAEDEEARIRKGIALHDQGELDQALKVYEDVIRENPGSSWAHFERHQTQMARAAEAGEPLPDWAATHQAILDADPLYPSMAEAKGKDEFFELLRRRESEGLFRDRSKMVPDLLKYAEIATDLGEFGFAAMIEWNLLSSVKPEAYENRDLIEDVLYNLDLLGVKGLKANFKGDHEKEFARIDAERETRREKSGVGRIMKDKP